MNDFLFDQVPDQNLTMAAIALSGLSFEKGNAWRVQSKAVRGNIKDPYLRAMFAFLSPDNDPNYEAVLVSKHKLYFHIIISYSMCFICRSKKHRYRLAIGSLSPVSI